ncbi:MAG: hypothetical protein M1829_005160 [Trizodia sp. TS-e1964]|nr:MAG: hypothetical protein M1829_005160 [Trizodia sp. TS-e1964]
MDPDMFVGGGWWHDARVLEATGQGLEKEEPRAWEGCWNEQIVKLVELSMQQHDAFCVLLTGRTENSYAELVKRILASKKLEFDMICLKPYTSPYGERIANTMSFKQELMSDIMRTYKDATEIRVYEDRPNHVRGFREFFTSFNKPNHTHPRKHILADVIQVADTTMFLDPVTEVAVIQRMINDHNTALTKDNLKNKPHLCIKQTTVSTGYLIDAPTSSKIKSLIKLPKSVNPKDIKWLANHITITLKPAPSSFIQKLGGMGAKQSWEITGIGSYDNKVWAIRVSPIGNNSLNISEFHPPHIAVAQRKHARASETNLINNWHPLPKGEDFIIDAVVGDRVSLTIEEASLEDSPPPGKRKLPQDMDYQPRDPPSRAQGNKGASAQRNSNHGPHGSANQRNRGNRGGNRSSSGNYRGNQGGSGRGGRGRGGAWNGYRSLDEFSPSYSGGGGSFYEPNNAPRGGSRYVPSYGKEYSGAAEW